MHINKVVGFKLPQLQPQYQRMCSYVQCNKLESQAKSAFFDAWDRNGLVQNMC